MTISASIVRDSVSVDGQRITTFLLHYPRFIHSEFMTHRAISRNASSSRAIPFARSSRAMLADTAMPISFRQNQSGMQAGAELAGWRQTACVTVWKSMAYVSYAAAHLLDRLGAHKQYVNRLLEPYSHITVVATATDWNNFFALRIHPDAQPEIHELAIQMLRTKRASQPAPMLMGRWHLPFVTDQEIANHFASMGSGVVGSTSDAAWRPLIALSVARCARTSYLNHDRTGPTIAADQALHNRLLGSHPIHASPAEHQATPDPGERSGNFSGWRQYRKMIPGENVEVFDENLVGR